MGTKLWGPDTWYVIHVIADSAPDIFTKTDTENYKTFYESLAKVLPCPSCAQHFQSFQEKDPPVFQTRMEALRWTIRAHNHVNKITEAPVLKEDDALDSIQAEISAREYGYVRGRRSTYYEMLKDNLPAFLLGSVLAFALSTFFRSKM